MTVTVTIVTHTLHTQARRSLTPSFWILEWPWRDSNSTRKLRGPLWAFSMNLKLLSSFSWALLLSWMPMPIMWRICKENVFLLYQCFWMAISVDKKKFLSTRPTFSSCVSDQERDLWASVLSRISRRIWNITSESSRRRNGWKAAVSVGGTGGGKAENEKMFLCVLSGKKLNVSSW